MQQRRQHSPFAWVTIVVILVMTFSKLPFSADAFTVQLKSAANALPDTSQRIPNWLDTFQSLADLFEDDQFHNSIREYMREAGDAANYCRFAFVECDDAWRITELHVEHIEGLVKWDKLPAATIVLSVRHSLLRQDPDLRSTPKWLKYLELENVTFEPEHQQQQQQQQQQEDNGEGGSAFPANSPATTLVVSDPQSMATRELKTLICRNCHLHSVDWETLPHSLLHLDLSQNKLRSAVVIGSLPASLRLLNLSDCNAPMDTASLRALPKTLHNMDLSGNALTGSMDTLFFPMELQVMRFANNRISGKINLENIPFGVVELDFSRNQLEGPCGDLTAFLSLRHFRASNNQLHSVAWDKLPSQLLTFEVANNLLTGSLPLEQLPLTLETLDVRNNKLTGQLHLGSLPVNVAYCDVSGNQLSGRADFTKLSPAIRFLYVQKNQLEGNPDLTLLPVDVRRVLIYDNNWDSLMPPL